MQFADPEVIAQYTLTPSLPVTRICVNFPTVYNETLVAKGLIIIRMISNNNEDRF